jgi:transcription elongation factor Elf1
MKAQLTAKAYILCPACNKGESQISHLFDQVPRQFGPWSCDECGTRYEGWVNSPTDIEVRICKEKYSKVIDVLVLEPQAKPLYVAVASKNYGQGADSKRYFYEQHTCPTNWTREVQMLLIDGNCDPHGLFRYVGTQIVPDDFGYDDDQLVEIIEKATGVETA